MSLRNKFLILLSSFLAIALFVAAAVMVGSGTLLSELQAYERDAATSLELTTALAAAAATTKVDPLDPATEALLARADSRVRSQLEQLIRRSRANGDAAAAQAGEEILTAWQAYHAESVRLFEMAATDPVNSIGMVNDVYNRLFPPFSDPLRVSMDQAQSRSEAAAAQLPVMLAQGRSAILAPLLLAPILIGVLAWLFVRQLKGQIGGFVAAVERLRAGELAERLPAPGRDEISQLGTAVNRFLDHFHHVLVNARDAAAHAGHTVLQLGAMAEQVRGSAGEQRLALEQISAAVEQLSGSFHDVARHATNAATASTQAEQVVLKGTGVGQQTVASLTSIDETMGQAEQVLSRLSSAIRRVTEVVGVIRGITEQTNLLALNAAIEAARAGPQGRGFAVVADEVRQLSQRTASSAGDIAVIVNDVLALSEEVTAAMAAARSEAACGTRYGEAMGNAMAEIEQSARTVSEMLETIAAATEQQSGVAAQIAERVERVAHNAQLTGSEIDATHAAIRPLAAATDTLRAAVGRFRLERAEEAMGQAA